MRLATGCARRYAAIRGERICEGLRCFSSLVASWHCPQSLNGAAVFVAVVVSTAEWAAVSAVVARSAQDSVVASVGSVVDLIDSTAASAAVSFLETAFSSALETVFSSASDLLPGVTGLITVRDGVILIPAIRTTIILTLARTRPRTPITALRPRRGL